jgi:phosphate transport system substrate-binding protein
VRSSFGSTHSETIGSFTRSNRRTRNALASAIQRWLKKVGSPRAGQSATLVIIAGACSGDQSGKSPSASATTSAPGATATTSGADLTGAGSTFAYPLYSKWAGDYATKAGIKINYQSIGSGGGIRQFSEQTVDFGGTDAPMTDEELAKAKAS